MPAWPRCTQIVYCGRLCWAARDLLSRPPYNLSTSPQAYNKSMDHSKLVVAKVFGSPGEADLAKSMLESAGIDSIIQADTAGGMDPAIAWSDLGFRVLVREEDASEAREVLNPPQNTSAEPAVPNDEDSPSPKPSE